jgi:hypothetical protein
MDILFTTDASGVSSAGSRGVVVSPAAASKLVITQQPSATAIVGVAFTVQPIVKEADQYGNVIKSDSMNTVTAARGNLGTGSLLGPDLTVTLVNGVAAFQGLYYDKAETMNIAFTINASGVSGVTSRKVVVGGGPRPGSVLLAPPITSRNVVASGGLGPGSVPLAPPVMAPDPKAVTVNSPALLSALAPAAGTTPPDPLLAPLVLDSLDPWAGLELRKLGHVADRS